MDPDVTHNLRPALKSSSGQNQEYCFSDDDQSDRLHAHAAWVTTRTLRDPRGLMRQRARDRNESSCNRNGNATANIRCGFHSELQRAPSRGDDILDEWETSAKTAGIRFFLMADFIKCRCFETVKRRLFYEIRKNCLIWYSPKATYTSKSHLAKSFALWIMDDLLSKPFHATMPIQSVPALSVPAFSHVSQLTGHPFIHMSLDNERLFGEWVWSSEIL